MRPLEVPSRIGPVDWLAFDTHHATAVTRLPLIFATYKLAGFIEKFTRNYLLKS